MKKVETYFDVIIVGAGHAGAQAAIALRQQKFAGSIGIIGDEPEFPYERPPLSKEYLSQEKPFERLLIRPKTFWDERGISLVLSTRIASLDSANKFVMADDGLTFRYGKLIWAAGASPRKLYLPGFDLPGVHYIRNRADVDRLASEIDECSDIAVVGGGYIGLEAAAVLRKFGKNVTLLEAMDRVLARVAGVELSRFYAEEHERQGVHLLFEAKIEKAVATSGRLSALQLENGDLVAAQMAIVGIGVIPVTSPLTNAGAVGQNGVDVDEFCRTSLQDVYAIGDCSAHHNKFAGNARIRVESVQNANDQAVTAAKAIVGVMAAYSSLPWFWSNQYDLKLQTVGISTGYDRTVIRGDTAARRFTVVYLKQGKIIALDCVNSVKDYVQGRKLVVHEVLSTVKQLRSVETLKDLVPK